MKLNLETKICQASSALSVQTSISLIRLALCSLYTASTNVHFTCRLTCPEQIPYKFQHYLCSRHYSIHVTLVLQPDNNATNGRGQFEIPLTRQLLFLRLSQRTLYNTMAAIFHVMIMWHDNVAQPEIPISGQFLVLRIVAFRSGQRRSRCGVATLTALTRPPVTGTCTPLHSRKIHEGRAKGVATLKVPWRHLFDVTSCVAPPYTCITQFCRHVTLTIFLVMSLL